jgi:hypothetical protein
MIKIGTIDKTPVIRAFATVNPSLFLSHTDREHRISNVATINDKGDNYSFYVYSNLPVFTAADLYYPRNGSLTPSPHKWMVGHPFLDSSNHFIMDWTDRCTFNGPAWKDGVMLRANYLGGASLLCRHYLFSSRETGVYRNNLLDGVVPGGTACIRMLNPIGGNIYSSYHQVAPFMSEWDFIGRPNSISHHNEYVSIHYVSDDGYHLPYPVGKTIEFDIFACLTDLDRPLFETHSDSYNFRGMNPGVWVTESETDLDPFGAGAGSPGHYTPLTPVSLSHIVHDERHVETSWNDPKMMTLYFDSGSPSIWSGGFVDDAPDSLIIAGSSHDPSYHGGYKVKDFCHNVVNGGDLKTLSNFVIMHSRGTYKITADEGSDTIKTFNFAVGFTGQAGHIVNNRCIGVSKYVVGLRIL